MINDKRQMIRGKRRYMQYYSTELPSIKFVCIQWGGCRDQKHHKSGTFMVQRCPKHLPSGKMGQSSVLWDTFAEEISKNGFSNVKIGPGWSKKGHF